MSDETYRLIANPRDVVRFGRLPGQLPLDDLGTYYDQLADYYRLVIGPKKDEFDYLIVEEHSLAATLFDDRVAMARYFSPLVDGFVVEGSINYTLTVSGWVVIGFEYIDEEGEEFTVVYFTPTPTGAVMDNGGHRFLSLHYDSIH